MGRRRMPTRRCARCRNTSRAAIRRRSRSRRWPTATRWAAHAGAALSPGHRQQHRRIRSGCASRRPRSGWKTRARACPRSCTRSATTTPRRSATSSASTRHVAGGLPGTLPVASPAQAAAGPAYIIRTVFHIAAGRLSALPAGCARPPAGGSRPRRTLGEPLGSFLVSAHGRRQCARAPGRGASLCVVLPAPAARRPRPAGA